MALGGAALAAVYGYLFLDMRPGPPLVIVGLGGLTLVLCGRALWRVIDPLTGGEVAAASTDAGPRTPHRLRELEREKQAVLKAIKEIELDYQMRKLDESDYREMVERYRARALRILSELAVGDNYRELIEREVRDRLAARAARPADAGAGAAEATATAATTGAAAGAPTCAACGTVNDADAGFCKRCGGKLGV
jgi:xanthosine utilization system XapX-like protein